MKDSISTAIAVALSTSSAFAQQGDKKGQAQPDVVPQHLIPPSPTLTLDKALKSFELADGFSLEAVATGDQAVVPVALTYDEYGRIWLVEMIQYMLDLDGNDENKPKGRIKVLEDIDGDGKIDKVTIFRDDLVAPRAVAVLNDGILFCHKDQLIFQKRKGLQPIGEELVIDKHYARGGNAEHKANGLLLGRDNWYYNAKSGKRYRRIEGKWVIQNTTFRGQWGITQDDAGRLFHNSNSNLLSGDKFRPNLFRNYTKYTPKGLRFSNGVGSNAVHPIRVTPALNRAYTGTLLNKQHKLKSATAASGITIYRGENFPKSFYGMGFSTEPGGHLIKAIKVNRRKDNSPTGSHPYGKNEFLASTDEWFRPVNVYTAPDGTLHIVDMYFGLIQHKAYMTSYLRRQYSSRNLDKPMVNNGRIYRVRHTATPASKVPKLSGKSVVELIDFLSHPNGTVRDSAQRLLVELLANKNAASYSDHITDWRKYIKSAVEKNDSSFVRLHGLWVSESTGSISSIFLDRCLNSTDDNVVAAALELAHLADNSLDQVVIALAPKKQSLVPYFFSLGKIASTASNARAQELLAKNPKVKYLNQAYFSGLGEKSKLYTDGNKGLATIVKEAFKETSILAPFSPKGEDLVLFKRGEELYLGGAACAGCHQANGAGMPAAFPQLTPSDWVTGDTERLGKILLHGLKGPIMLNGKKANFPSVMPGLGMRPDLKDRDIAAIMTYIRNMEKNRASVVRPEFITKLRKATAARNGNPYTEAELMKAAKVEINAKPAAVKNVKLKQPVKPEERKPTHTTEKPVFKIVAIPTVMTKKAPEVPSKVPQVLLFTLATFLPSAAAIAVLKLTKKA